MHTLTNSPILKIFLIFVKKIDGCGDWPTDYWGFTGKSIVRLIH